MTPIEKNIIVSDAFGRQIGSTYPKRAKGLLQNGRAEYVSDREIRLKNTHVPAVYNHTEDKKMSKVIDFNARDFEFEASCKSNVGFRGFVTTPSGNEEVWEIGDWGWNWTQIATVLTGLQPNTDYVFRFAMTLGHNDDNREESLVHILRAIPDADPEDPRSEDDLDRLYEEEDRAQAWKERYTYCIRQSRFQPVISKRDTEQDTMVRVFELPFRTDTYTDWKIIFVSQHAIARFFTAKDNASYEGLADLSYEQWREARTAKLEAERAERFRPDLSDVQEHINGNGFINGIPASIFRSMNEPHNRIGGIGNIPVAPGGQIPGGSLNLSGATITSRAVFDEIMALVKNGVMVNLSGAEIDFEEEED